MLEIHGSVFNTEFEAFSILDDLAVNHLKESYDLAYQMKMLPLRLKIREIFFGMEGG